MADPTNSPPESVVETDVPEDFDWSMLSMRDPMAMVCQRTSGLPCGRTVDLLVRGQFISLSADN